MREIDGVFEDDTKDTKTWWSYHIYKMLPQSFDFRYPLIAKTKKDVSDSHKFMKESDEFEILCSYPHQNSK